MNKKEYNDWVEKTLLLFVADNEVHSGIDREDLAKKYAMAKGMDIPEVDEVPKPWRAEINEVFYMVTHHLNVGCEKDTRWWADDSSYACGNYFRTKERAKEVAERMRLLYRLEQLHDIFCPDYKPDWDDDTEIKFNVYKSHLTNSYEYDESIYYDGLTVHFPSEEIAKKVCDILNKEFA